MFQISNENIQQFQNFYPWIATEIHPHSKIEVPSDIRHKMSIVLDTRKSNFGSQQWLRFHIWFIMTLCCKMRHKIRQLFYSKIRQKFITKCVSFFITKCDSFNTKFDSYNKMRQFYYKMQQLLQNATFVTKCVSTYPIYKSETMSYEGLFFSFFDILAQFQFYQFFCYQFIQVCMFCFVPSQLSPGVMSFLSYLQQPP